MGGVEVEGEGESKEWKEHSKEGWKEEGETG